MAEVKGLKRKHVSETEGHRMDDDEYMKIAREQQSCSNDRKCKVGACIVSAKGDKIGKGYNCMPHKQDGGFPWGKKRPNLNNKHLYVCHAELNAVTELMKMGESTENCTLYATLFPCNECAKLIVQCGIKEVVYGIDVKAAKLEYQASRKIFEKVGVKCREYKPTNSNEMPGGN